MKAIDVSRIRKMLSGAEGQRLARSSAGQSSLPERSRNRDSRSAAAKLLARMLELDPAATKKFDDLLSKDNAKLAAILKKAKAEAVKNSRGAMKTLDGIASQQLKAIEAVAAFPVPVGSPHYDLLNIPFMIWPSDNMDLEADEIVPSSSFCKFRIRMDRQDSWDYLKFYYLWSNPKDKYAVINIDAYLIFNGYCSVAASGGFFAGSRASKVSVKGHLDILEWWNQPPTLSFAQPDQAVNALTLEVSAQGLGDDNVGDARSVFRGYDLQHTLMLVPPLGAIVFAVTATVDCTTGDDSGVAEADFASGAFQISSPAVLVTVLS